MKKYLTIVIITMLIMNAAFYSVLADSVTAEQAVYSQGDGSLENPYIITTAKELDAVRENLSAHYKLGNDIDLTEYLAEGGEGCLKWGEAGWEPIGKPDDLGYECFTGSFDGAYHIISGLWINRADTSGIGLFGGTNSYDGYITIQNLGIELAEKGIVGRTNVGGLVGYSACEIRNCYVSATAAGSSIKGAGSLGGLIGSQGPAKGLYNCYAEVDVISEENGFLNGRCVGGLIGLASGHMEYCYATGNVKGFSSCGGLVGDLSEMAAVLNCYATGNVTGSGDNIGGLVGYFYYGHMDYSYSTGTVQGKNYVGGLIGKQAGLSTVSNCYSSSKVIVSEDYAGGLVGAQISPPYLNNFNSIDDCYVEGSVETSGEHCGAVSGYVDEESTVSNSLRINIFTMNGSEISVNDENSHPDKIHGGATSETMHIVPPIINAVLSETEMTDKPVTVKLNIASHDEIHSLNYVKADKRPLNSLIAAVSCNTELNQVINSPVISDYYNAAGYPNDDLNVQGIKDNSFEINQNGRYIVYAEDKAGNKSFMCIDVDNINADEPVSDYPYEIKKLAAVSQDGNELIAFPESQSFIMNIEVLKNGGEHSDGYLIAAVYDTHGTLIDCVSDSMASRQDSSFRFNIPAQPQTIGSVKVFIWSSFNSMIPLAKTEILNFNQAA